MDAAPVLTVSRPFLCDIHHGKIQHFQQAVIGRGLALSPQHGLNALMGICKSQYLPCLSTVQLLRAATQNFRSLILYRMMFSPSISVKQMIFIFILLTFH